MTITEHREADELADLRVKRIRAELADLDYRRGLAAAAAHFKQVELAAAVKVTQPAISSALKRPVEAVAEGFSGATPMEICQRYAAGLIDRTQLMDELIRFPYAKPGHTDGYDSLIVDPPGTWFEVVEAADGGLIDDDLYDEVLSRRHHRHPMAG